MATINPAGSDDDRGFRRKMWLGHHQARIGMAAFVGMGIVFTAVTLIEHTVAEYVILGFGLAGMAVSFYAQRCDDRVHLRNLCPLDLDRLPLTNPQAEVDRRAAVLYEFHSFRRRVTISLLAFVFMMLGIFLGNSMRERSVALGVVAAVGAFMVMVLAQIRAIWVNDVHRRLQPWCPHCRWGGRGPGRDRIDA